MSKLTVESLEKIKEKSRRTTLLRAGTGKAKIIVHMGTCGIAAGARKIRDALIKIMEEQDVTDVILTTSGCAGLCSREPMATVERVGEAPAKYVDLTEDKIRKVFMEHVIGGQIVIEYALALGCERTH